MKIKVLLITAATLLSLVSCQEKKETNHEATVVTKEIDAEVTKEAKEINPSFELVWETDTVLKTPESCFYYAKENVIYVSNINQNPRKLDHNGFISKLSVDGKILDKMWVTGLSAPKGIGVYNTTLYVTDIDAVVEIDLATGKIIKRSTLEGSLMLNDISVDQETGLLYVSDMDTGKVYSYKDGVFTIWKDGFNKPNGVLVDGDLLLVASAQDNTLTSFVKTSKEEKKILSSDLGNADGVVKLNSGNYVVSDWRGEIHYITKDKRISLFNTIEDKKAQTADIGSIPDVDIILVPTFFGNQVKAFKIME